MSSGTIAARKETVWVVCAGMYRSASTLQYQIASELIERSGRGYRLPWSSTEDFDAAVNAHRARPGMKTIKCHGASPPQMREFRKIPTKILYSYRDLRDVAASIQRKWDYQYSTFGLLTILDEALAQYSYWLHYDCVLVQSYETLIDDLPDAIRKISEFLELSTPDEMIDDLAEQLSLENQRLKVEKMGRDEQLQATHRDFIFSEKELLHTGHITDGRTGGYKSTLSPKQIAVIDCAYGDWLREHGYEVPRRRLAERIAAQSSWFLYRCSRLLRRLQKAVT